MLSSTMLVHNILFLMLLFNELIWLAQETPIFVYLGQEEEVIWSCPDSDANL